jgi:predicted DNA-binding protein
MSERRRAVVIRTFRLLTHEDDALARIAAELGVPKATVVRQAIGEFAADFLEQRVDAFPVNTPSSWRSR